MYVKTDILLLPIKMGAALPNNNLVQRVVVSQKTKTK